MRSVARTRPTATFLVLAFMLSWAAWLPLVVARAHVRQADGWPTHLPGLIGPAAAALIPLALADGRAGVQRWLRGIARWRVPTWCYLLVAATLAVGLLCALAQNSNLDGVSAYSGTPDLGFVLTFGLVLALNGLGEEAGWRGFLVDRLLAEHGLVRTSASVGVAWALWHLPLFVFLDSFRGLGVALVGWVVGLFCGSVVLTWLYVSSGQSILVVALWHTAYNFTSGTAATDGLPAAVTSTAVIVAAAFLVARAHERKPREVVAP